MAENNMKIILDLIDNASADFKKINSEAIKQVKDLEKQTKETSKEIQDTEKKNTEERKKSNKELVRMAVSITAIVQAMRFMARQTSELIRIGRGFDSTFNDSMINFEQSVFRVQQILATKLIPIIKNVADFWSDFLDTNIGEDSGFGSDLKKAEKNLDSLRDKLQRLESAGKDSFQALRGGSIVNTETRSEIQEQINAQERLIETLKKQAAVEAETSPLKRSREIFEATQALKEHSSAVKENQQLFITGKQSVEEYYQFLLENNESVIEQNKLLEQSYSQLAALQAELGNNELISTRTRLDEQITLLNFYSETYKKAHAGMAAFTVALGQSIQTNLSGAISNMVLGVTTAKEAMKQLGQAMIKTIVDFMAQKLVAFALEKTLLAGTVASTKLAATSIAAAWAPAAFAATVATLGGAAAQAPASLAAAGAASASVFAGISAGMQAAFSGGDASRSISVENFNPQADGGDYMVNKPTLFLAGEAGPERATFTPIRDGAGGGGQFGDVNIYIQGGIRSDGASVEDMGERLGFEFERAVRVARG